MSGSFEGWYYKHQAGDNMLALIPGRSEEGAFIQVVARSQAFHVPYPLHTFVRGDCVRVGNSRFSTTDVELDIQTDTLSLSGSLLYENATPIAYDIMGPFSLFPMECRHTVLSMNHRLAGRLTLNGQAMDFTNGTGYIEGDSGRSFPEEYSWVQCNDFHEECSVMASIARIPFLGLRFWGCIAIVWIHGREYRLATYTGAKILRRDRQGLEIRQGNRKLMVELTGQGGQALYAPTLGKMHRTIHESLEGKARFRFSLGNEVLLDEISEHASFEYEG